MGERIVIPKFFEDVPVEAAEYMMLPFDYFIYRGFLFSSRPLVIVDDDKISESEMIIYG